MEDKQMKNSVKRLLLLAVSVIALALVVAPVSFAGEDDPGPTQAGETQAPQGANTLAEQQGPSEDSGSAVNGNSGNSGNSGSSTQVLGATETFNTATTGTTDVVKAKGGIQAGFGGMATQPTSSTTLAGLVGILFALAAAVVLIPVRLRSQD
jgi:hypothetical protein